MDGDTSVIEPYECENYSSAEEPLAKQKLDELLQQELYDGKISKSVRKPHCIHAYGAVPKKESNDFRPITDCSRPSGKSINNYIHYDKVKYKTVDYASKFVTKGCFFASVDLSKAYRSVPVYPDHRLFQGFRWVFGPRDKNNYEYYIQFQIYRKYIFHINPVS